MAEFLSLLSIQIYVILYFIMCYNLSQLCQTKVTENQSKKLNMGLFEMFKKNIFYT